MTQSFDANIRHSLTSKPLWFLSWNVEMADCSLIANRLVLVQIMNSAIPYYCHAHIIRHNIQARLDNNVSIQQNSFH